jgi:hypothetical protein
MKEILFVTGLSVIFLFITVIILLFIRRAGKLSSIIWSCVYLALISLLFELARQFQSYLGKHEIFLDFGHADLGLIILMSFCYFIAILTIIVVFIMRSQV